MELNKSQRSSRVVNKHTRAEVEIEHEGRINAGDWIEVPGLGWGPRDMCSVFYAEPGLLVVLPKQPRACRIKGQEQDADHLPQP
jgi:hypothetical protein